MIGVILAGGTGSRLFPLTKITNKHLLPVGNFPMIYYPIYKLVEGGIQDIVIVTGKEHAGDVVRLLGSGKDFNVNFTYKIQDRAGGIAEALGLVEPICKGKKSIVLLGDNIFEDSLIPFLHNFENQEYGARLLLKEIKDPHRFGVAEVQGDKIISIVEKPKYPKSSLCVTGIYMYDERVFDMIKTLKPSERGELEITDINNMYLKNDQLYYDFLEGWWTDAGTFSSMTRVNDYLLQSTLEKDIKNRFNIRIGGN
jgi:glucose-1-phosphate thymidylyltransferase